MIRFFTFSAFHGKNPVAGSTHIRVNQLIKYWDEADLYKYGENPDVLIFQKVYCTPDYQFPRHFENKKILDICDPDWLNGVTNVAETCQVVDAVTCPTGALKDFLSQLTDKPVVVIPDRFDYQLIPKPRLVSYEKARTAVWFGYSHNAELLRYAMPLMDELGLNLIVISDDDPLTHRYSNRSDFKNWYTYVKYDEETVYQELQKADFCLLPQGSRPIDVFKSNNKTVKAILAGLPVAYDAEVLRSFIEPEARQKFLDENYQKTYDEYDCRKSIKQFKELIANL